MRVINIELPATLASADPAISLASDEIRAQLFHELKALDAELNETVRQRAKAYFPENFSVFVRTHLAPDKLGTLTELWIVDPNVRWPAGLLTRRAWSLFIPILAHAVREGMSSRFQGIHFDMHEQQAIVRAFAPRRSFTDPVLLSIAVAVLTSLLWVYVVPHLTPAMGTIIGP